MHLVRQGPRQVHVATWATGTISTAFFGILPSTTMGFAGVESLTVVTGHHHLTRDERLDILRLYAWFRSQGATSSSKQVAEALGRSLGVVKDVWRDYMLTRINKAAAEKKLKKAAKEAVASGREIKRERNDLKRKANQSLIEKLQATQRVNERFKRDLVRLNGTGGKKKPKLSEQEELAEFFANP
ncbi:hypothetical protein H257_09314 [Aphanomyces astaci]|uniref:Uncharacterized protein n=1 Tax=Aphanomyces astaci TaxID=112090 RepID=W4GC60_APHAT|nr:hypothetical protein H257_09314 [Aphanomyces astaci]ETV76876.1 hypothetical protein H257_09314 [Aphanomyces astaci]|eukprot:XP_009833788.1 hypothetical protein H257_09314 [Aphanomyces astaci]